jgi:hypothetical protein
MNNRLYELVKKDGMSKNDLERLSMFYILSSNNDLYSKINYIYDFDKRSIRPDCLEDDNVDFCSSSRKLIRLAFNLYNGFSAEVLNTFAGLDDNNFEIALNSLKIRFNR